MANAFSAGLAITRYGEANEAKEEILRSRMPSWKIVPSPSPWAPPARGLPTPSKWCPTCAVGVACGRMLLCAVWVLCPFTASPMVLETAPLKGPPLADVSTAPEGGSIVSTAPEGGIIDGREPRP